VNEVENALPPGKLPDTTKLKVAARDILSTTASVMSDSGISKMGDSHDPSQKAAQDEMKKMRDAAGLTPAALDSLKKAASLLQSN
jgi:5,10-methenyltetrahydromethanopterin hydrogenase